jgi:serine/threonine protein kinase
MLLLCVQGGFSEVHLANDKLTGKEVALKVVFLNKAGLTKDQVCIAHLVATYDPVLPGPVSSLQLSKSSSY